MEKSAGNPSQLTPLGTIELGNLQAKIVKDEQGRKCAAIALGQKELLFPLSQLLLVRELLDACVKAMTLYIPADPPSVEEP